MIDLNKNPIIGVITYFTLLVACLLEITLELGAHNFDSFISHHGLAIFVLGSLLANKNKLFHIIKFLLLSNHA